MKTILYLQTQNENRTVTDIVTALSSDTSITESDRAVFNRLNADGYAKTIDETLTTLYGERELRPTILTEFLDVPFYKVNISSYLKRRAEYFKKCMMYIDAEYNPVENYMGVEVEEKTFVGGARAETTLSNMGAQSNSTTHGARSESGSNTIGQQSNSYTHGATSEQTRTDIGQQENTEHLGAVSTTVDVHDGGQSNSTVHGAQSETTNTTHGAHTDNTTEGVRTERTTKAPFESSSFYNESETTRGGAVNNGVIQSASDSVSYGSYSDSGSRSATSYTDTENIGQKTVTTDTDTDAITNSTTLGTRSDTGMKTTAAVSDTETTGTRSDSNSFSATAYTDNETIGQRSDSESRNASTYTDTETREFTRHGNIGVLSAGELLGKDESYWKNFLWLFDTTHDIANLISRGVCAL